MFGQCSFVSEDGRRCRARRYTRTRRQWRASDGFCRVHEPEYFRRLSVEAQAERLSAFVEQVEDDAVSGCWFWRGEVTAKNTRGRFYAGGIQWLPHRFAYAALVGGTPNSSELNHLCGHGGATADRGPCVNPAHLLPMTKAANRDYVPSLVKINRNVAGFAGTEFEAFCQQHDLLLGWAC